MIRQATSTATMRANVFRGKGSFGISFALDDIAAAYDLFGGRREGVIKVALRP
jgi:hypothetical protein